MDEYDTLMDEMLTHMNDLWAAGLVSERTGPDYSSEEMFIILAKKLSEMATSRSDTSKVRGNGNTPFRERVLAERVAKWDNEKATVARTLDAEAAVEVAAEARKK